MRLSAFTSLMTAALLWSTAPAGAAGTPLIGTIEVMATIQVASDIPATAPISATAEFFYDVLGVSQSGSVKASAKRSGKTATATLKLPYRFTASNNSKLLDVTLTVTAQGSPERTASVRVQIPVPANGAATVVKLPVSM